MPEGASAFNRAVSASVGSLVCCQVEERLAARALAFHRPVAASVSGHGDEQGALWQSARMIPAAIATMAAWLQILWSIVLAVVVQVVNDKGTLLGLAANNPCDKITTGEARMGPRADLFVKNSTVLWHQPVLVGKRMVGESQVAISGHPQMVQEH